MLSRAVVNDVCRNRWVWTWPRPAASATWDVHVQMVAMHTGPPNLPGKMNPSPRRGASSAASAGCTGRVAVFEFLSVNVRTHLLVEFHVDYERGVVGALQSLYRCADCPHPRT